VICSESREIESLLNALHGTRWRARVASSCAEAIAATETTRFGAVICGMRLPDGTWKDVRAMLQQRSPATRLIVFSRFADERLWADVLHLGGYDVLQPPFDSRQVLAAVDSAWLSSLDDAGQAFARADADYRARLAEFETNVRQLSADLEQISRRMSASCRPSKRAAKGPD
jgi:FixJ family two-component response regulator